MTSSLTGALALDTYRLKTAPTIINGRYHVRLRENEQEITTLDRVRLVAVDHDPAVRAYGLGDQVLLGTLMPARRVTTRSGQDITALVTGDGTSYFVGEPGETLSVEFTTGLPTGAAGVQRTTPIRIPLVPGDDGKGGGGARAPEPIQTASATGPLAATGVDAQVLLNTGILIQVPDGAGGWRTAMHRYPRESQDECVVDSAGQGPVRMVFLGEHKLWRVAQLAIAGEGTPQSLTLLSAQHSRLGNALTAVTALDGITAAITPGDTLGLEFGATSVPPSMTRDFFLLSNGVYTSVPAPQHLQPTGPGGSASFALEQNQPNPFAKTTTIGFALPTSSPVRLDVFDLQGRLVRQLANRSFTSGHHAVAWDRRDRSGAAVAAGVYLYRLSAGTFVTQRKMVLLPE